MRWSCLRLTGAPAQRLAEAAPAQFVAAVQQAVQQQLAGDQVEDKARTLTAIELVCGILASGSVFGPGGAPGISLLPMLLRAIACPSPAGR